jgi:hypothetical protein
MSSAWPLPAGLPPGRLIVADPRYAYEDPVTDPVLWVSDELVPGAGPLWARLVAEHRTTGLWPLLLVPIVFIDQRRPWHAGELSPFPASVAEQLDVRELLATGWMLATTDTEGVGGVDLPDPPYPSWPGLAAPGTPGADPEQHAISLATAPGGDCALTGIDDPPYLGLVPSRDSAGTITACGWFCRGGDPAELTAVVRSWQQRFGARLCSLGYATLYLAVAWPPATREHARRVAAEHWAFCPSIGGFVTFDEYAEELVGAEIWSFFWE